MGDGTLGKKPHVIGLPAYMLATLSVFVYLSAALGVSVDGIWHVADTLAWAAAVMASLDTCTDGRGMSVVGIERGRYLGVAVAVVLLVGPFFHLGDRLGAEVGMLLGFFWPTIATPLLEGLFAGCLSLLIRSDAGRLDRLPFDPSYIPLICAFGSVAVTLLYGYVICPVISLIGSLTLLCEVISFAGMYACDVAPAAFLLLSCMIGRDGR